MQSQNVFLQFWRANPQGEGPACKTFLSRASFICSIVGPLELPRATAANLKHL